MKSKGLMLSAVAVVLVAVGVYLYFGHGGQASPLALQGDTQRYTVKVDIDAAKTGTRTANIEVSARSGAQDPDEVTLEAAMVVHSHAAPALVAARQGPGHFRASGDLFFMDGPFELTVALTSSGQREQITFPVVVEP